MASAATMTLSMSVSAASALVAGRSSALITSCPTGTSVVGPTRSAVTESHSCVRCNYLGTHGIARVNGFCNWCISMGREDDRLRALKGMKTWIGRIGR